MQLINLVKKKWKVLVFVFLFIVGMAFVTAHIKYNADLKALQDLEIKCDLTYGKDNYVLGYCDGSFCCSGKSSSLINWSVEHPIIKME